MATNRKRRLPAEDLKADRQAISGIQLLTDYEPRHAAYSVAKLQELNRAMEYAQQAELRANQAQAIARDLAIAAEWAIHDFVLGVKTQAIAQYGPDGHELQLLGLKRKSDRRQPVRRAAAAETTA
jgi:hypothetical protein